MPKEPMYIAESKMDFHQRAVWNLQFDESYIVVGCAGSGKSCLALLKIKALAEMNKQPFYLVTLVRSLVEYLRNEMGSNNLPRESVITHEEWTTKKVTPWCAQYFKIPDENRVIHGKPNFLLVDECQDLSIEEISKLRSACQGIFLYGDDEQQIMAFGSRVPTSIGAIREKLKLPVYRLQLNYRLPKPVAEFAQEISGSASLKDHCKNERGGKPFMVKVPQKERAKKILFLSDNQHYEDVGVLCRTDDEVQKVVNSLRETDRTASARYDNNGSYEYINQNSRFKVMNFHQAKGQQFEAVFLLLSDSDAKIDANEKDKHWQYDRNLLYVGVTRTYHALYIFYEDSLPDMLRPIPLILYHSELDSQQIVQV